MKKILFSSFLLLLSRNFSFAQATATDFTTNDCSGTSHHLFAELDAGKVVVIAFVMPCGSCIAPSVAANNTVKSYASSNPGKVVFYLSDDLGTTSCSTLSTWANTNGLSGIPIFGTTAVKEAPYGSGGMPKIVVLGGKDHKVYYVKNGAMDATNFKAAIDMAIAATTGIEESTTTAALKLNLFPNPANEMITVAYTLTQASEVNLQIYNALGEHVKTIDQGKQTAGDQKVNVATELMSNGVYFLKVTTAVGSQTLTFTVANH